MPMTRRTVFDVAALAGAGVVSTFIRIPLASADTQVTKAQAQYQDQPKGGLQCSQCTNFMAPSGCRVVSGQVSPGGWCQLFQAKSS